MPEAEYDFSCASAPQAGWRVTQFHLREALCSPFVLTVDLADAGHNPAGTLLGQPARFELVRASLRRTVAGVVRRATSCGTRRGIRHLRVEVVPALWLLSQRRDVRIFQGLHALDIVREVLRDAGVYQSEGALDDGALRGNEYPQREVCVQYNESDLDFITRLLVEEGVAYLLRADTHGERLVLVDDGAASAFTETVPSLDDGPLRIMGAGGATAAFETIRSMETVHGLAPSGVVLRDWDFTHPFHAGDASPHREARATHRAPAAPGERVEYIAPAHATYTGYDEASGRYAHHDLGRRAQRRHHAHESEANVARGESVVTGMAPGRRFDLRDEDDSAWGGFLVTAVEHRGRVSDAGFDVHDDDVAQYSNSFEATLHRGPYRPMPQTPRPVIRGPQTAVVMARPGADDVVDIDVHGRVLVRFHWERPELRTPTQRHKPSSCRVRVAQPWAGAGWGVVFHPRVGMEVVVQFLDGDPDRPIITGAVYNLHNPAPPQDELVARRTRSTLRTQSVPGGVGFNELSFEDAAGAEEVFLHAHRNLREAIGHDHATAVRRNHSLSVGGDQSVRVHGTQHTVVSAPHTDGPYQSTLQVTGSAHIEARNVDVDAQLRIALVCGELSVTLSPQSIELRHAAGSKLVLRDRSIEMESEKVVMKAEMLRVEATRMALEAEQQATLWSRGRTNVTGTPLLLNGPGTFAGRVTELAPQAILTGSATVNVGGPAFPLPIVRREDGTLQVGRQLLIRPGADPNFQGMVLRDLGVMATTESGRRRLENIERNPGRHTVVIREMSRSEYREGGWNNSVAHTDTTGEARRDAGGRLVPGPGGSTEIGLNPEARLGRDNVSEPTDATLFHELGHAEHAAYGVSRTHEPTSTAWDTAEEWQTIDGGINRPGGNNDIPGTPRSPSENEYLAERGFGHRRVDHSDTYAPIS